MRYLRMLATVAVATTLSASTLLAQTPAADPSARLREVLPIEVAEQVLATIASARQQGLPAEALENRALKFAARGVEAKKIERSIAEQAKRMGLVKAELAKARSRAPDADEIDAGAEAMRKGVDGAEISKLAKSAPSGRSLVVPLAIIGSLIDRGLPSAEALTRVQKRLEARATDSELQQLPSQVATRGGKPGQTGRDLAATKRPGAARGGSPAGIPAGVPAGIPVSRPVAGRP